MVLDLRLNSIHLHFLSYFTSGTIIKQKTPEIVSQFKKLSFPLPTTPLLLLLLLTPPPLPPLPHFHPSRRFQSLFPRLRVQLVPLSPKDNQSSILKQNKKTNRTKKRPFCGFEFTLTKTDSYIYNLINKLAFGRM